MMMLLNAFFLVFEAFMGLCEIVGGIISVFTRRIK
jgi:hypothetical protein